MRTGKKVVAVVRKVNGVDPEINITDNDFEVVKTKEGTICIVHKKSEEYYALKE